MGFQRSLSDSDRDRRLNPHPEANTLRAVPRQLYSPRIASNKCCRHSVAQGLLAYPATKCEELGRRRRKDPLQRIDEPDLGIHPSGVLRLIDTRCDSPNGSLRKLLCARILATGRIAISAVLIFTGRIAEIAARLPAIRRQASQPRGRRDGNRNPIVPVRMPSIRSAIDTPRLRKGAGFGHNIRSAGGEQRLPARGVSTCREKPPPDLPARG